MKAKQIEKLLTKVINNLIDSISDDRIKIILKNHSFITGGCIPSMIMDEYVNDYDIYITEKKFAKLIKEYYTNLKFDEKDLQKKKVFLPKLITDNSINLTDKIQIVIKYTGSPTNVVERFDWDHIKSYFTLADGLKIPENTYRLIMEKELIYTGSDFPLSSLLRLRKFLKKGWTVSTKTMVHIVFDILGAFDISKYNQFKENNYLEVIEDFNYQTNNQKISADTLIQQLNGVDPLTIQRELEVHTGKYLSLNEIIELLN